MASNPDCPDWLVHFTGRPPSFPPQFDTSTAAGRAAQAGYYRRLGELPEERMRSIFAEGGVRGFEAHGTFGPVVCFSELSYTAISTVITTGFTPGRRAPYKPWALVFHKAPLLRLGVRPVLYLSYQEMSYFPGAPTSFTDRCVRSVPGDRNNDWSHEREWRLCSDEELPDGASAGSPFGVGLGQATLMAVIADRRGWTPHQVHHTLTRDAAAPIRRWVLEDGNLVDDGPLFPTANP